MKRIIIVTDNFVVGGIERAATVLANGLSDAGYQVTYLVLRKIFPNTFYELNKSVRFLFLPEVINSDDYSRERKKALHKTKRSLKIYKLARVLINSKSKRINDRIRKYRDKDFLKIRTFFLKEKHSIVISFNYILNDRLYLASKGCDCKLINAAVNSKSKEEMEDLVRMRLHKPNVFICQTFEQLNEYKQYLNIYGVVIRNPVLANLPEPFQGIRKKKIVNFCRTHPIKNLPMLIDAFNIVHDKYTDFELYIYGSTTTELAKKTKEELILQIKKLGLSKCAFVLDSTPFIHEIIVDFSAFVSSSDSEGLSNSMLEAMALGLPCVCTDCIGGGAREMIEDGVNGLLVSRNNTDEMAKAIIRFIEDKQLAEKCGKNAATIRDKLSVNNIISQWSKVIESL